MTVWTRLEDIVYWSALQLSGILTKDNWRTFETDYHTLLTRNTRLAKYHDLIVRTLSLEEECGADMADFQHIIIHCTNEDFSSRRRRWVLKTKRYSLKTKRYSLASTEVSSHFTTKFGMGWCVAKKMTTLKRQSLEGLVECTRHQFQPEPIDWKGNQNVLVC